ncbi:hypothetical protein BD779DRAFT_1559072 [Infundibulicybe gibba]|nr:hypothetical protein BD779DRAFT_1559072 [Infundibulicybe gibba]
MRLDAEESIYNGKYIRLTIPPTNEPGCVSGGQVEAILSPELKMRLKLSGSQFPRPIDHPPEVRYYIKEAPGMGLGAFALCDLSMGDLILAERPLLVIPAAVPLEDMSGYATELQARTAILNRWDETLKASLRRMSPENQRSYMALANNYAGQASMYSIVCNNLSRVNHSCSPNTDRRFDVDTFSLRLYACRDIKKDEQLFLTYYPALLDPHQERQRDLAVYGFTCNCQSCEDGEASDRRRKRIAFLQEQWQESKSLSGTQMLETISMLIELIKQEGIESIELYGHCMQTMSGTCISLGDEAGATRYMEMYNKWNQRDDKIL